MESYRKTLAYVTQKELEKIANELVMTKPIIVSGRNTVNINVLFFGFESKKAIKYYNMFINMIMNRNIFGSDQIESTSFKNVPSDLSFACIGISLNDYDKGIPEYPTPEECDRLEKEMCNV